MSDGDEFFDMDEDDRARSIAEIQDMLNGVYENIVTIPTDDQEQILVKSLKDNCLDCITKNFGRFNNAYLSSHDSVLRRNLEFLQRVYSSQVIHSLGTKLLLEDVHLDFLINEFLNEFDMEIFVHSGCSMKAIEKRIVLVGNGFIKVSLDLPYIPSDDRISEFINATICHLPNVEVLRILQNCNDNTLKNISSFCTKLSVLNIDGSSSVTSEGLKMLCKGQGEDQTECLIKILSIRHIQTLDSAVIFLLNKIPHLEVLNYNNLPAILHSIHQEDLKNNTLNSVKKYNLTKVEFLITEDFSYLSNTEQLEILRVWTEVCPNIKTVYINVIAEDFLGLISRFANLENFKAYNFFSDTGTAFEFNNFLKSNGLKLKNLQIKGFVLSVPILIERCPKLENLVLSGVQFQSLDTNHTKEQPSNKNSLHSLSELGFVDITFSDQYAEDSVINILCNSPKLRNLSFMRCEFKNCEMKTKLAKFCDNGTLQHLSFFHCDADMDLFESIILTCSSLLSLTIDSCAKIRGDDALSLRELRDTLRSFVKIVYTNFFSDDSESDFSHYYNN